jgi:RNA repair pathway DNA polymerase beta family
MAVHRFDYKDPAAPPEVALGLDRQEFFVWSTAENERRNGPDDIDITLYSLRKWAGLAAKGNPTALHFLFAPNFAPRPAPWHQIVENRRMFLSRKAALQFRGFADAQIRRLQGMGTGKKGQRHEPIGVHGYDVKAAMHTVRLLNEGIELMRSGVITLPRPEKELLITIRTGQYGSLERLLELAGSLFFGTRKGSSRKRIAGGRGPARDFEIGEFTSDLETCFDRISDLAETWTLSADPGQRSEILIRINAAAEESAHSHDTWRDFIAGL